MNVTTELALMDDVRKEFLQALVDSPPNIIASIWILNRVPVSFENDVKLYEEWRRRFADLIGVDAAEIVIIGSGAFGISLNPHKNYRCFDDQSDIDVAIVSEYFFNTAWRFLRNLGSDIFLMPQPAKQSVRDHVNKYVYWGTIATDKLLPYMPFGKQWSKALVEMSTIHPTTDRVIKARIYKDFESLRAYQVDNLKKLRSQQLENGL